MDELALLKDFRLDPDALVQPTGRETT